MPEKREKEHVLLSISQTGPSSHRHAEKKGHIFEIILNFEILFFLR